VEDRTARLGDSPVFLLFVLAFPLILAGLFVAALFAFVGPLLGFLISLPFRIIGAVFGLVFGLLGALIALPLLVVGLVLGILGLGFGLLLGGGFLLLPLLPIVLVALGIAWLVRRSNRRAVNA
jgi:hypothetical protein